MNGLGILLSGSVAFLACVVSVPLVGALATRLRLYDPVGPLKIHTKPVARVGGVAILTGLLSGFGVAYLISGVKADIGFCIPLAALFLVGLIDDLRGISPWIRLIAQTISAAFFLLWHGGSFANPAMAVLTFVLQGLFILVSVNAFNFLDGADGIVAGVAPIIALGFILAARSNFDVLVAILLLGSSLGFLIFNFPPAKIFMGDNGSTTLGFGIAFLSLRFWRSLPIADSRHLIPLLFAAVPLLDMLFAIIRRLRSGVPITEGDRRHFYDLLLRRDWPPRIVAICCYVAAAVTVSLGWICQEQGWAFSSLIAALVVGVSIFLAAGLGSFEGEQSRRDRTLAACASPPGLHS
jgi:UDP-GlcNAc:undecaprenyl-phosphate/decaprenyl-phosphate GlcNAc-1-phosphate transferase